MKINTAIEAATKVLSENNLYAEVAQFETLPAFTVAIRWGDWKHEHLRAKWLIESNGIGKLMRSKTTEEDGSDCYSATHYFICC